LTKLTLIVIAAIAVCGHALIHVQLLSADSIPYSICHHVFRFVADGTTTNTTGATDASACIPTVVVPASELPALLELANTSATTGSRRLAAVDDPNGPCARLAIALEEKGLVKNASTFLGEVRRL
jgi:hypothetical protein